MEKPVENLDQKPVCLMVLGPHRCGTSAVSGVLNHLGMDLPATLMPPSEGNALGYFESLRVMSFNDKLLNALGSDWKDLSPMQVGSVSTQVFESFMSEAHEILHQEFSNARIPLLKDPRICRFVGFWTEAFNRAGYSPLYIHIHRNPLETADSLEKRDAIPVELGLLIWLRHVLDAESATRGKTRVFTNYKALLDDWRTQILQMEEALGLTFHRNTAAVRQDIDDFLSDKLRHQHRALEEVRSSAQVAGDVREAFRIFESWAGSAGNPSDYDTLDALRSRLDGSLDQIAIFLRAQGKTNELVGKLKSLEQRLGQFRDEKTKLAAELEHDRRVGAEKDAAYALKLAELQQSVGHLRDEKTRLVVELEHDRKKGEGKEEASAKVAELEGLLRQRSLEAEDWFEENRRLKQALEASNADNTKLAREHGEERTRLQESLSTLDNKVRGLEKSVDERFEEIAQVSKMLLDTQTQRDAEAVKLANQHGEERTRLQESLRSRDDQIRGLEQSLGERLAEIAQLSKMMLAAETQRDVENTKLATEHEEERTRLQESLLVRDDQIRSLEKSVEERFSEIAQVSRLLLDAQTREMKEHEKVEALLSSTSWRIAGPLRWLVTLIRK